MFINDRFQILQIRLAFSCSLRPFAYGLRRIRFDLIRIGRIQNMFRFIQCTFLIKVKGHLQLINLRCLFGFPAEMTLR